MSLFRQKKQLNKVIMPTVFFSLLSRTISAANFLPRIFLFIRPRFLFFLPTFSAFFLFFINVRSAGSVLPRNRKRERKPRIYGDTDATRPTDCTPEEMYEVDIHFGLWKKSTPFSPLCLSVCLRASISLCTSVSPFNRFFFFTFSQNIDHYHYSLSAPWNANVSLIVPQFRSLNVFGGWSVSVPRHRSRFIHFCLRRSRKQEITARWDASNRRDGAAAVTRATIGSHRFYYHTANILRTFERESAIFGYSYDCEHVEYSQVNIA